jgi:Uma2 family endonuclease
MSSTPKLKTTYEQWLELPDNITGEIISGDLIASPRPGPKHSNVSTALGVKVGGPFQYGEGGGPGGWIILFEPEIHIKDDIVVPDFAGWKRERLSKPPDEAYFSTVPDWICEILSPSSVKTDRIIKQQLYLSWKINHYWIVDPILKSVEILERAAENWVVKGLYSENDKMRAPPFDMVEIDLKSLWWD